MNTKCLLIKIETLLGRINGDENIPHLFSVRGENVYKQYECFNSNRFKSNLFVTDFCP